MAGFIRRVVARDRQRYQGLDITCLHEQPNILAMSFPATGLARMFRNPAAAVLTFLRSQHAECFKVYNLCEEHVYPAARLGGQVVELPCEDHQAPPLALLHSFCTDAAAYLAADARNTVVVHCKAGKGRTGVFICALLLHLGICCDVDAALKLYTAKRMLVGEGVTIPSQIRFLRLYTDGVRTRGGLPRPRALTLSGLTLSGLPPGITCRMTVSQRRMCMPAEAGCDLGPACVEGVGALPGARGAPADARRAAPGPAAVAACAGPHAAPVAAVQVVADASGRAGACLQGCVVQGEVKVLVQRERLGRLRPLCYAWLSTAFLAAGDVVLPRSELDKVQTAAHLTTELRMSFVERPDPDEAHNSVCH